MSTAILERPDPIVTSLIHEIRGHKVMLDSDLAKLYAVETRVLNQAVKRNLDRFPEDFMFQLTPDEAADLKSHFVTSSHGGRRKLPYAFTEQGISMLSSVLNSRRAVHVNIEIMRTFVRLRRFAQSHEELAGRLKALESKYEANSRSSSKRSVNSWRCLSRARSALGSAPERSKSLTGKAKAPVR